MDTAATPNLSKEQNLIKDHDGLDGLPGYVVVVFEKLDHGTKFVTIVDSGERFKRFQLPFFSSPDKYFAVAVNESILSYSDSVQVTVDDDLHEFTLIFNLAFRASDPRVVAELRDPLRQLTDMIAITIKRSCERQAREIIPQSFREFAQIVLSGRPKLNKYAASLGIEIISLMLDRRLSEVEILDRKINGALCHVDWDYKKVLRELLESRDETIGEALETEALETIASGINWPADLREAYDVGRRVSRSQESRETPTDERVMCTVFAPHKARRGGNVLVQVFAHLLEDEIVVKQMAAEFDEKAGRLGFTNLAHQPELNSKLVFCLSLPGLQVDEPVQELMWRGGPEAVQFGVRIPKDFIDDEIIGTIQVSEGTVPLGHVKFLLRIEDANGSDSKDGQQPEMTNTWKRYEYAFISYASEDRAEVLKRVQMLARLHIEYFQDVMTLEPGERWEKNIYKSIDRSDVFFLFWSTAARDSQWVMKEVRYALEKKGEDKLAAPEIVPVIIEGPPPVPPPDELKDIHFNDAFIYFIN